MAGERSTSSSDLATLDRPKTGFHAFRRFRVTSLRQNSISEELIRFWLGHAGKMLTDRYSKLTSDVEFQRQLAEKIGLGFELPLESAVIGPNGPKIEVGAAEETAVNC